MKTMIKVSVWGGNLLFCLATMGASTQHFQVDEYGNIYANGAKLAPGVIAPDPVSGLSTLSYQLFLPINHGDIVLFEPGTTNISDILRFGGAALGTLFFFSDAADASEPGNLADGPLPTPQANAAFFAESGAEGE